MTHLLRAGLFAGFVILGLLAARSGRGSAPSKSPMLAVYISYILLLSFGAGLSQQEVWPFSTWPLIAGRVPTPVSFPRIVALDAQGHEHAIDDRAYLPLEFAEFMAWRNAHFSKLNAADKREVNAYLLGRIETARRAWIAGTKPQLGPLGPLSSPYFVGNPEIWSQPGMLPAMPLTGLRTYEEQWDVEKRDQYPDAVHRRVIDEYRPL